MGLCGCRSLRGDDDTFAVRGHDFDAIGVENGKFDGLACFAGGRTFLDVEIVAELSRGRG